MENDKNNITSFCWLVGQFLAWIDNQRDTREGFLVVEDFVDSLPIKIEKDNFKCFNQGTALMMCYGLLVYPREIFGKKIKPEELNNYVLESVGENIKDFFEISNEIDEEINTENILRHLRNSISHSKVKIDSEKDIFVFKDVNSSEKKFEGKISGKDLGILLAVIGRYFTFLEQNS
jgi:hypothetical protein